MTLRRPPATTPALYAQDGKGYDAEVHAHYFLGANDWLVTEYNPEEEIAFGWVCLNGDRQNAELGYMSLREMQEVRAPMRLHVNGRVYDMPMTIEYDEHWTSTKTLREAIAELDRRSGRPLGGGKERA